MIAALIQSGGAWLPDIFPEATVDAAIAATPLGTRLILDKDGTVAAAAGCRTPVSIALGPEGGMEHAEKSRFVDAGFAPLRLAVIRHLRLFVELHTDAVADEVADDAVPRRLDDRPRR